MKFNLNGRDQINHDYQDAKGLSLDDLMQLFFSELQKEKIFDKNINQKFLAKLIHFFQNKLGEWVLDRSQQLVQLNWAIIRQYLINTLGYDKEDLAPDFLLAVQVNPSLKAKGRANKTYFCFADKREAERQLAIVKFLIGKECPEFDSYSKLEEDFRFPGTPYKFWLNQQQVEVLEKIRFPDRLVKSLRFDKKYFFPMFLRGITHTAGKDKEPREELRTGPHKTFTVYASGIFPRDNKPSPYPKEKMHLKPWLSRHQSTTLIIKDAKVPVFGWGRANESLAGCMLDPDDSLWNRAMKYDGGTVDRPYEADTAEQAVKYLQDKRDFYFSTYEQFRDAVKRDHDKHNEVLARIRWNKKSSAVAIFKNNDESRWLAIFYAQKIKERLRVQARELKQPFDDEYEVPIVYYIPGHERNMTAYTKTEQQADIIKAKAIISDHSVLKDKLTDNKFEWLLFVKDPLKLLVRFREEGPREYMLIVGELLENGLFHIIENLLPPSLLNDIKKISKRYVPPEYSESLFIIACVIQDVELFNLVKPHVSKLGYNNCYLAPLLNFVHPGKNEVLIAQILLLPAAIKMTFKGGNTALHIACQLRLVDVVDKLIARGASLDTRNTDGKYPLDLALDSNNFHFLLRIFQLKLTISTKFFCEILVKACVLNKTHIVRELLVEFLDEEKLDYINSNYSDEILLKAIEAKNIDLVQLLLDRGITPSISCVFNLLIKANALGQVEIVRLLSDANRDILKYLNRINRDDSDQLFLKAIKDKNVDLFKFLLDRGLKPSKSISENILIKACELGQGEIVRLLLEVYLTKLVFTLSKACELGQGEIVKLLFEIYLDRADYFDYIYRNYSDELLLKATESKNVHLVKMLLDRGLKPSSSCARNLIIKACELSQEEMVILLLDAKVDAKSADKDFRTALYIASQNGHFNILRRLLANGADERRNYCTLDTPLILACRYGHLDIVRELVLNFLDSIRNKKIEDQRKLFNEYINDNCSQNTPVRIAIFNGHAEVAQFISDQYSFLNRRFTVTFQGDDKKLFIRACEKDYIETLKFLFASLPNGTYIGNLDCSDLIDAAAENDHREILKELVLRRADINNSSALTIALNNKNFDLAIFLLENGINPNYFVAIQSLHKIIDQLDKLDNEKSLKLLQFIELAIDKSSKLLLKPKHVSALIFKALSLNSPTIIEKLLHYGVFMTITDADGQTPIMSAIQLNQVEMIKHLIDLGFDLNMTSSARKSALTLAMESGQSLEIVTILVNRGADVNCKISKPLQRAILKDSEEISKLLVSRGAKLHLQDSNPEMNLLLMAAHKRKMVALRGIVEAIKALNSDSPYALINLESHNLIRDIQLAQLKEKLAEYQSERGAKRAPEFKRSYRFFGQEIHFGYSKESKLAAATKLQEALCNPIPPELNDEALNQGALGDIYQQYLKLR